MAIRHGLPGQYGKDQAIKRFRKMMAILALSYGSAIAAVAFVLGFFWSWGNAWRLLSLVPILIINWLGWRGIHRVERYLNTIDKERIWYLRGGQAEALVGLLLGRLENEWHVFHGIKLEKDSDIDHVVVGPGGVFCISTKSQRGVFTGTSDGPGLLHNGRPSPFAKDAMRQTMEVSRRLGVAMGRAVPWVQAVLAVPFGYTERDACNGKVWLVHHDNIVTRLFPSDLPPKLDHHQIMRVVKVLESIQSGAADVYERPSRAASSRVSAEKQ